MGIQRECRGAHLGLLSRCETVRNVSGFHWNAKQRTQQRSLRGVHIAARPNGIVGAPDFDRKKMHPFRNPFKQCVLLRWSVTFILRGVEDGGKHPLPLSLPLS